MDESQQKDFVKELEILADNYGIKHAAFCGETKEGNFIGLAVGEKTPGDAFLTAQNIGRLWQFIREQVRNSLNKFDLWNSGR